MEKEVNVIVLSHNCVWEEKKISNTLDAVQDLVGGIIEIPLVSAGLSDAGISITMNESGKLFHLKPSAYVVDDKFNVIDYLAGTVVFSSHDEEGNMKSLSPAQLTVIKELIRVAPNVPSEGGGVVKMVIIRF